MQKIIITCFMATINTPSSTPLSIEEAIEFIDGFEGRSDRLGLADFGNGLIALSVLEANGIDKKDGGTFIVTAGTREELEESRKELLFAGESWIVSVLTFSPQGEIKVKGRNVGDRFELTLDCKSFVENDGVKEEVLISRGPYFVSSTQLEWLKEVGHKDLVKWLVKDDRSVVEASGVTEVGDVDVVDAGGVPEAGEVTEAREIKASVAAVVPTINGQNTES